ncbi:MAG: GNAT family N-acetyltransferase [Bacteroidales bacterium]|nr:GNAT family N-acetyltransferase [Bacteroidales bacterium]
MNLTFKKISRELLASDFDDFIAVSDGTEHDNWGKDQYMLDLEGKWEHSMVAYFNRLLAGYIIVSIKDNDTLHIHRFIVNNNIRGQGTGKAMLNELEKTISSYFKKLTLKVYEDNVKAIAFYEKNGFKILDSKNGLNLMEKYLND